LFSFVSEKKKIYYFFSYFSFVLFHPRGRKEEDNSFVSLDGEILVQ